MFRAFFAIFAAFCTSIVLHGCSNEVRNAVEPQPRVVDETANTKNTKQDGSLESIVESGLPQSQSGSLGGSLMNNTKPHPRPTEDRIVVPLVNQGARCSGPKIGVYSWDQTSWKSSSSPLITHLAGSNAKSNTCGDVYINIADYSNPDRITNAEVIAPFMKNVRRTGNEGTIYLTYGDVQTRNTTACRVFIDTFFAWLVSVPVSDRSDIMPVGISLDIEHFPFGETELLLKYAQSKKSELGLGEVSIQWTIEGRVNPVDTEAVMRYADSALMMAYRNYMTKPEDLDGSKHGLLQRMVYMLKEQCVNCLDDEHANKHHKAKITIMVETACNVPEYCDRVSFCASDKGVEFVLATIETLRHSMISSGLVTQSQSDRLFNQENMFSIHHWEWFQCYYDDNNDTNKLCDNYRSAVQTCKNR